MKSKLIVLSVCLGILAVSLHAGSSDPTVVHGTATFDREGGNWTITTSHQTIINWRSFGVDAGTIMRFVQPGRNSLAVNRVMGLTPSLINGTLTANGRLVLINPNGIMVGPNGVVSASSFMASTLDASNQDLLNGGDINFFGHSMARIENLGTIKALNGDVTLISQNIINSGQLLAPHGSVNLAAGSDVLLTADGELFINGGGLGLANTDGALIDAAQAQLKAHHDNVYALAINNEGIIRATGTTQLADGRVILQGTGGAGVTNTGEIVAIDYDGRGGYVDTSSESGLSIRGSVVTGAGGEWLIDPTDLWVVQTANGTYSHEVEAGWVSGQLNNGGNVRLVTRDPGTSGGGEDGDINITATIEKTSGGDASLILRAHDDIVMFGGVGIVNSSADGKLNLRAIAGSQGGGGHSFMMKQNAGNESYIDIDGRMYIKQTGWAADLRDVKAGSLRVVAPHVRFRGEVQTTGSQTYDVNAAWAAGGSLHAGGSVIFNGDVDGANWGGPRDFAVKAGNSIRFYGDVDPSDASRALSNVMIDAPTVWLDGQFNAPTTSNNVQRVRVLSDNARIQDGIDIVSAGGRVDVGAGTYFENIDIYKALRLRGDVGTRTLGPGAGAPIIDGGGSGNGVHITSGDVTVEGFVIRNTRYNGIVAGYSGNPNDAYQNIKIRYNRIDGVAPAHGFGIYVGHQSEAFPGGPGNFGSPENLVPLDFQGLVIQGNEITGAANAGIVLQSLTAGSGRIRVVDNYVHHNGASGLWIDSSEKIRASGNTFESNFNGVFISGLGDGYYEGTANGPYDPRQIWLRDNTIVNNANHGVALYDGYPAEIRISENTITGNGGFGVYNYLSTGGPLDASGNYWGTVSWAGYQGQAGIRDMISGNVEVEDWYDAGLANLYTLSGLSNVYVDDDWAGSADGASVGGYTYGYNAFALIQDGIENTVGSTVNVAAGTYNESIVIDKPLALLGSDGATLDGTGLGLVAGVKIVSGNVTFDNMTVQNFGGDGIIVGYEPGGPGNLQNVVLTNNVVRNIQPGSPHGFGIYVGYEAEGFGDGRLSNHLDYSGLVISGNEVYKTANAALVLQSITSSGAPLTVSGNCFHDAGASGVWIETARNIDLTDNTITNNSYGVFLSSLADGWFAANGTYGPKDINIIGNAITNNGSGLVHYAGWAETLGVHENAILDNGTQVANHVAGTLNASANWWGSVDESAIAAGLSGDVDFTPYLASGTDTDAAAGFQGDFSTLYVTTLGSQSGGGRINEGIGLLSNSTLYINSGYYAEDVVIDRDANLVTVGAKANSPVTAWSWVSNAAASVGLDGYFASDVDASANSNGFAFNGSVLVNGYTEIQEGPIVFGGTVDSAAGSHRKLYVKARGSDVTFADPVGASTYVDGGVTKDQKLSSLVVTGADTLNLHDVYTTGSQRYKADTINLGSIWSAGSTIDVGGSLVLLSDSTIIGSGVTFDGTIDSDIIGPKALTVTDSATTTFLGEVGGANPLGPLSINGGGTAIFHGDVTTRGGQSYANAVQVAASATFADEASGNIQFNTLDGPYEVSVVTGGDVMFDGPVGDARSLGGLEVTSGGIIYLPYAFGGAVISTSDNGGYDGDVVFNSSTQLRSDTELDIAGDLDWRNETVYSAASGPYSLMIGAGGNVALYDFSDTDVAGRQPGMRLRELVVDAGGNIGLFGRMNVRDGVYMRSGGKISRMARRQRILANELAMLAESGIGIRPNGRAFALRTQVGNLEAETRTGGIYIRNRGDVTLGNVGSYGREVRGVRTIDDGDIRIVSTGDLRLAGGSDMIMGAEDVFLRAGRNVQLGDDSALALALAMGEMKIRAGQNVRLYSAGAIGLEALTIRAGRNVRVRPGLDLPNLLDLPLPPAAGLGTLGEMNVRAGNNIFMGGSDGMAIAFAGGDMTFRALGETLGIGTGVMIAGGDMTFRAPNGDIVMANTWPWLDRDFGATVMYAGGLMRANAGRDIRIGDSEGVILANAVDGFDFDAGRDVSINSSILLGGLDLAPIVIDAFFGPDGPGGPGGPSGPGLSGGLLFALVGSALENGLDINDEAVFNIRAQNNVNLVNDGLTILAAAANDMNISAIDGDVVMVNDGLAQLLLSGMGNMNIQAGSDIIGMNTGGLQGVGAIFGDLSMRTMDGDLRLGDAGEGLGSYYVTGVGDVRMLGRNVDVTGQVCIGAGMAAMLEPGLIGPIGPVGPGNPPPPKPNDFQGPGDREEQGPPLFVGEGAGDVFIGAMDSVTISADRNGRPEVMAPGGQAIIGALDGDINIEGAVGGNAGTTIWGMGLDSDVRIGPGGYVYSDAGRTEIMAGRDLDVIGSPRQEASIRGFGDIELWAGRNMAFDGSSVVAGTQRFGQAVNAQADLMAYAFGGRVRVLENPAGANEILTQGGDIVMIGQRGFVGTAPNSIIDSRGGDITIAAAGDVLMNIPTYSRGGTILVASLGGDLRVRSTISSVSPAGQQGFFGAQVDPTLPAWQVAGPNGSRLLVVGDVSGWMANTQLGVGDIYLLELGGGNPFGNIGLDFLLAGIDPFGSLFDLDDRVKRYYFDNGNLVAPGTPLSLPGGGLEALTAINPWLQSQAFRGATVQFYRGYTE